MFSASIKLKCFEVTVGITTSFIRRHLSFMPDNSSEPKSHKCDSSHGTSLYDSLSSLLFLWASQGREPYLAANGFDHRQFVINLGNPLHDPFGEY